MKKLVAVVLIILVALFISFILTMVSVGVICNRYEPSWLCDMHEGRALYVMAFFFVTVLFVKVKFYPQTIVKQNEPEHKPEHKPEHNIKTKQNIKTEQEIK